MTRAITWPERTRLSRPAPAITTSSRTLPDRCGNSPTNVVDQEVDGSEPASNLLMKCPTRSGSRMSSRSAIMLRPIATASTATASTRSSLRSASNNAVARQIPSSTARGNRPLACKRVRVPHPTHLRSQSLSLSTLPIVLIHVVAGFHTLVSAPNHPVSLQLIDCQVRVAQRPQRLPGVFADAGRPRRSRS